MIHQNVLELPSCLLLLYSSAQGQELSFLRPLRPGKYFCTGLENVNMEKSRGENKENSSSKNELYPDQYSGPVDNRCCICLDLRTGTFIVGALHLILDLSINFM